MKEKRISAVKMVRKIRDKHYAELEDKSFEERNKIIQEKIKQYEESLKVKT